MSNKKQIWGVLTVENYEVNFVNNIPEFEHFKPYQLEPCSVNTHMDVQGTLESIFLFCSDDAKFYFSYYVWLYYKNEEEKELLYKFLNYIKKRSDFPKHVPFHSIMVDAYTFSVKKALGLSLND